MPKKVLPLKDWLPDQADLGNLAITAKNVAPWKEGYKSFPSFSVLASNALTARFQGGTFAKNNSGDTLIFSGDATKLYKFGGTSFSDITRITLSGTSTVSGSTSADAYTTGTGDWWEFIVFGSQVIGVNGFDVPQQFTIGTATYFGDLGGSPPVAKHIAVVRDFVVLGNVDVGSGFVPHRVQWSGINNAASWSISAATQADFQLLDSEAGAVQKIIGGEYGVVVQERAITRMTYVGSPVIFQFDQVERNRGSFAPQSVVSFGNRIWFIAEDGFYEIAGGSPAMPIGDGRVDRFFLGQVDLSAAHRISAAVDPVSKLVLWAWPTSSANGQNPNRLILYNWVHRKWAYVETDIEGFVRHASPGFSLEDLDGISSSMDALTQSFDSPAWSGGRQALGAYNTSHILGTFSGPAMDATVDTGEYQLTPGRTSYVNYVRPLVDGNTSSVTVGARSRISAAHTFGVAVPTNADGTCFTRSHARYHRFRVETTGTFNFIQGVEVEWEPGNERADGGATVWDTLASETIWDVT